MTYIRLEMLREIVIEIYLTIFKLVFTLFKLCPLKDKAVFVVSFSQNNLYIYNEIRRKEIPIEIIFLVKKSCINDFKNVSDAKVIPFETANIMNMLVSIYHLASSKYVIVDNYFGFLSSVTFKKGVDCIQLWHAAGAIKTFGWKDQSIKNRSAHARKRFEKVYKQFNKVVVGSEAMASIFIQAFNLSTENMLRTGVPRTDLFYDKNMQQKIIRRLYQENPVLKDKKVILYAPTYRDSQLNKVNHVAIDIEEMYRQLKDEYVLLLKFHPAIKLSEDLKSEYKEFAYDYSSYRDINELLLVTDILITDYSSIPHEFAILNRPMIFFPYDLNEYNSERGLWGPYEELVPGPIAYTTTEILSLIKENHFDYNKIQDFNKKWNLYSDGHSCQRLVEFLFMDVTAQDEKERKAAREVL